MHAALLIWSLVTSTPALASARSDLTTGVVAFEAGDFDVAVRSIEEALEGDLRAKDIPKAHYYLARATIQQLSVAARAGESADEMAPLKAAESLIQAREADNWGRWEDEIRAEVNSLHGALLFGSLELLNANQPAAALPYAEMLIRLRPDIHSGHDALGQVYDKLDRKAEARKAYAQALSIAEQQPPNPPDLNAAYVAFRVAIYERYEAGDPSAALALLERGVALLAQEWGRIDAPTAQQQQQHDTVAADLRAFRLDILRSSPDMVETALAEFAAATQTDPTYATLVAYAQLLEDVDVTQAIETYERAIAMDGSQAIAPFNLGAIYMNRAVVINQEAVAAESFEEVERLSQQALAEMQRAKPYLEQVLVVMPDNLEAIRALMTIAAQEGDDERYLQLKAARDRAEGR